MGTQSTWGQSHGSTLALNMQAFITLAMVAASSAAPQYAAAPVVHAVAAPDLAEPSPYTYTYAVADDYSKANFQQSESNDGTGAVTGYYSVNLPDGRIQTVPYNANDLTGNVATVEYAGEAQYPLPLLVDTSLLPPWLLTLFMLLPSLPTLSTLPLLPMPSTLPLLLPTPPTALLPTAKLLMKDCPVLVKYLIIYLFDAASVVPYY